MELSCGICHVITTNKTTTALKRVGILDKGNIALSQHKQNDFNSFFR